MPMGRSEALTLLKAVLSIPRLQSTRKREEVPVLFREPHINSGFRPPYRSWTYYLISLFQLHNETFNIWTHLGACMLFLYKLHGYSQLMDFLRDPQSWPLLAGGICSIGYSFLSSAAHLFHSKSELIHYTCFLADYAGIGLYGLGTSMMVFHYSIEPSAYDLLRPFYFPVASLISWLLCACLCLAKLRYQRPYPFRRKLWQIGGGATLATWIALPLLHRIFTCYTNDQCSILNRAYFNHLNYNLMFLIDVFFFAFHMPEKVWPGRFDLVGTGHQLFHITSSITTILQFEAAYYDLTTRPKHVIDHLTQDTFSAFGCIGIVAILDALTIIYLHRKTKEKLLAKIT